MLSDTASLNVFYFSNFPRFCFPFVQLINNLVWKRFKSLSTILIRNSQNSYSEVYSLDARKFYHIYVLHSIGFIRVIVERVINILPIIKRLLYNIRRFQCLSLTLSCENSFYLSGNEKIDNLYVAIDSSKHASLQLVSILHSTLVISVLIITP